MATPLVRSFWITEGLTTNRCEGYMKSGFRGNHVTPLPYVGYGGSFTRPCPILPNGARQPRADIPNLSWIYKLTSQGGINVLPAARNAAWEKFVEAVRVGPASLGVSLGELNQSLDMITNRALQLRRGYSKLRRGNFRGFLREFSVKPKRKHRNLVRSHVNAASSLWLEYSFGWKPLTADVYAATQAMSRPVPGGPVFGKSAEDYNVLAGSTSGNIRGFGAVKMGGDVYIINPNQYLAQQLGLANPAVVAWELVPFSFLADWVFDVGSFLAGFTDLLGCDVKNPWTTVYARGRGEVTWMHPKPNGKIYSRKGQVYFCQRYTTLYRPIPNTHYLRNIGTKMTRAANAVSLLGQLLTK